VLFMADPDLEETVLPPQFRGNLRATTPKQLIDSIQGYIPPITHDAGSGLICRLLHGRKELYIECRKLIESSSSIRDTTWGRRARPLGPAEQQARDEYRAAIAVFMNEEKDYRELVTAQGRDEYVKQAYDLKKRFVHYECRVLSVDISQLSMLDMMIADNNRIV